MLETGDVIAVACGRPHLRLEPGLPASVQEQPLLRRVTQMAGVPPAVGEHAELLEQLAHERSVGTRDRHVVRGPGVRADGVAPGPGVAAGFPLHFEQDEITKAPPEESPRRRQPGDAASDDHQRHAGRRSGRHRQLPIAQPVPKRVRLVYERSGEGDTALACQADERGCLKELASSDTHSATLQLLTAASYTQPIRSSTGVQS